jgi:hypothetical protein
VHYFSREDITNGEEAREQLLNIISPQENINKTQNEILHTPYHGYIFKDKTNKQTKTRKTRIGRG